MFTNFDKNVGHIKRFYKKDIYKLSKSQNLKIEKIEYYDSIGFFLILISKFIFNKNLKVSNIRNNINIWNNLIPVSKFFDKIFFNSISKSLICVLKKID